MRQQKLWVAWRLNDARYLCDDGTWTIHIGLARVFTDIYELRNEVRIKHNLDLDNFTHIEVQPIRRT